jgi:glycosyltransferase involved in cell wall biosynthesis
MSNPKTLDIILPCYNPRSGWEKQLTVSLNNIRLLLGSDILNQVILVNDGSSTGISEREVAFLENEIPELKIIEYAQNKGKGFAVRKGVKSAAADLQIYTDIDVPYVDEAIIEFYTLLCNKEADVVIASRGDSYYDALSWFRRVLSKSLRAMNGMLFGLKIKDTQGGLKGFNQAGRSVFLQTSVNRYLFDLEFIQKVSNTDLKLVGVNVELKPDVVLPSPSITVLLKEMRNFIQLLLRK